MDGDPMMSRRHDDPLHRRPSIQTSPIAPRPSPISRITQDAGRRPSSSTLYDVINRPDRNERSTSISSHALVESPRDIRDSIRNSDPHPPSRDRAAAFSPTTTTTLGHTTSTSMREETTAKPTAAHGPDQSSEIPSSSVNAAEQNRASPSQAVDSGPIAPQAPSMLRREPSQATEPALPEKSS